MRNSIRITLAVVLILLGIWGYDRSRPRALTDCFPEGSWEMVSVPDYDPNPGDAGEALELAMTVSEVKEAMAEVTVFHRAPFYSWTCANLTLHIRIDGTVYSAEIGEDGCVSVARADDPEQSRTYWCAKDGGLFKKLTN